MDVDMVVHDRIIYSFFDWLESMGGVPEILRSIA